MSTMDWITAEPWPPRDELRAAIPAQYLVDEAAALRRLLPLVAQPAGAALAVSNRAADWIERLRQRPRPAFDALLLEYDLSSEEGVLLMGLAEALLRIPDAATAERLIADKLAAADWAAHLGHSSSLLVNASTWGLMLGGRMLRAPGAEATGPMLARLFERLGEPVIRRALRQAMALMAQQFVLGPDIATALARARRENLACSCDMLGEAALSADDAARYQAAYVAAIAALGRSGEGRSGISVKLSALHPRYEFAQRARVLRELPPRLLALAQQARAAGIDLTVDAEEAERLELSLDVFEAVLRDSSLQGWDGLGLAVQAYQRRSLAVVDWLLQLARNSSHRLRLRLVKGAYWDSEIKHAQERGLADYPVFTRKPQTDVAYLACARRLLDARDCCYPMLATHNAHTIAALRLLAGDERGYELQRLHGMGEALYAIVAEDLDLPVRVYAPVGTHEALLPYLMRRLLENGANSSFVHHAGDPRRPAQALAVDPLALLQSQQEGPALPRPPQLYGALRRNAEGINLAAETERAALAAELVAVAPPPVAHPLLAGPAPVPTPLRTVNDPADRRRRVGEWQALSLQQVDEIVAAGVAAQPGWNAQPVAGRAAVLEQAAERLQARRAEFLRLLVREAGKTLPDAIAELREAIDFLRYYAAEARRLFAPLPLPGPTGEHNELQLQGRGLFVCISPWNFPLAIFTGQVAAALASGNAVIAKPAEQTPLVAALMTRLLLDCGLPPGALQLAPGEGEVGAALVGQEGIAGVAFTGSFAVAQAINRRLAARAGAIATLIAETGGVNAMIVDSSALPEQVVRDVLRSAYGSAGQRCSALRLLCLQDEIAGPVLAMLRGAMRELVIGDPALLETDLGPLIDADACERLQAQLDRSLQHGRLLERLELPPACRHGSYFAPQLIELDGAAQLREEFFGPVLHVVRYAAPRLDALVADLNAGGHGLTLGVHTRIESTWRRVQAQARVGNCYVNRGMTGAVVGVQPFGGEGLSGTGPKAGGPYSLLRYATERSLSVNTAAVGGNIALLK